ncbi:hypothetical protein [Aporhodopirellula aestuarii]|uniref:Histidine kinase n=1 Tax=Aporhodopirellula aestuarii TaxID=2950107 RepID=A0ABT0U011_9BACT|nr:hypothetical protein [Aporhodopirellula aestuarii]MCM2370192.1 hypothetical protein [Aporhodopirellula aestuarii]
MGRHREELVQSERLGAMGQMVSAIAHESRNALDRISRAKDDLQYLFEEPRGYAAPLHLEVATCSVASVWRQACNNLDSARINRNAELSEECGDVD